MPNSFNTDALFQYDRTIENESPFYDTGDKNASIIVQHLPEMVATCSILRFYPDLFFDAIKPEKGGIELDLYQRVMMRSLARFKESYFCAPRGVSKTMVEIMVQYFNAIAFPNITIAITASTKESAVKIWREKHDEILRFYPILKDEILKENFSKEYGKVIFRNGSEIDSMANRDTSEGLRRRRGSLEEASLIDGDVFQKSLEPIFNIPRTLPDGSTDPTELNHQINRFGTSGFKNSDEYEVIVRCWRDMLDLKGTFVFGSDWRIPVHFGRQKMSIINRARRGNIVRFKQNYLCEWVGCSSGAIINISKLMKARTIKFPELEIPRDKKGNMEIAEYIFGVDVARSESESNNKTAVVILKIIRNTVGEIRQVHLVNIKTPPNGLTYDEQAVYIKRLFYKYGGDLDLTKSRVRAIVVDANTYGKGLVDSLLKDSTDNEDNRELGCFDTINTDQEPKVEGSPKIVYALIATGINKSIITNFQNYVESGILHLVGDFKDIADELDPFVADDYEIACEQMQELIDEVANLKLKYTTNNIDTIQIIRKIDKDRYSALVYGLFYINLFLTEDIADDDHDFVISSRTV